MAQVREQEEEELELSDADAGSGGGRRKLIIAIVAVVVLLLGGGGAGLYFSGLLAGGDQEAAGDGEEPSQAARKPAIYVPLDPPFTVNLKGESRAKYLQIAIDVLTRDPAVEEAIKIHGPVIRNNLVLLLGDKTSQQLADRKGKEQLQQEVLQSVQAALKETAGADGVENVLFTTFVMQ